MSENHDQVTTGYAAPPAVAATYPDLAGKVAVVTGAPDALAGVCDSIEREGGRAMWVAADCTDASEVDRLAATVIARFGPVDIVAPFAGGNGMPVPTEKESAEHWREILDDDLTSAFLTVRAFLPPMIERRRGAIITMSSAAGRQAAQSAAAYAAAKAGVIAFTRHLAGEFAGHGIRANCVAPSAVENDRMRTWMTDEQRDRLGRSFPLGRLGQPADVAAATVFLASDASSWITGTTLDIAGGRIML